MNEHVLSASQTTEGISAGATKKICLAFGAAGALYLTAAAATYSNNLDLLNPDMSASLQNSLHSINNVNGPSAVLKTIPVDTRHPFTFTTEAKTITYDVERKGFENNGLIVDMRRTVSDENGTVVEETHRPYVSFFYMSVTKADGTRETKWVHVTDGAAPIRVAYRPPSQSNGLGHGSNQ